MPPIKCLLFDCDNTLVLSEALAFEACADLATEICKNHNIDKSFTGPELLETFVGQNFRGMMGGLQKQYNFKMEDKEIDEYVERELGEVIKKLDAKAEPCDGAFEQVEKVFNDKKYPLSVVSTSAKSRVVASLKKPGMYKFFPDEWIFSAATSLDPPTSKPDPAIYHHACKVIGFKENECVTVEDSKSGATAAMRAGIPLIGYVGPYYHEGEEKVKQMVKTLTEECKAVVIMHHWREFPDCLQKVIDS